MDLDLTCVRRLDFFRLFPMIMGATHPVGITNEWISASTGHAFLKQISEALPRWNRWYGIPYATPMFSTGPMFLSFQMSEYSDLWKRWKDTGSVQGSPIRLMAEEYYKGVDERSFFLKGQGNSWHGWDARMILWMEKHIPLTIFLVVSGILLALLPYVYYVVRLRRKSSFERLSS